MWSNKQKQLAIRACRAAGISDEQRTDMILMNFVNAHFKGNVTSTSPKLTSGDFEAFMAVVEGYANGKILHFTPGYWKACAADALSRMKRKALAIAADLENAGKLVPTGVGLAGWIEKRVSQGTARSVDVLDYHGLRALICGLTAYARQNGVTLGNEAVAEAAA